MSMEYYLQKLIEKCKNFQQLPVSGISDGLLYDTESVYAGGKSGSGNAH